ncbi:OmpA family protein [soil metagenome]
MDMTIDFHELKAVKKLAAFGLFVAALALAGCGSMQTTTGLLDQARADFRAAQSNSNTVSLASLELKQAGDALDQANTAAHNRDGAETVDRLAYIAKQKTAIAQEAGKQRAAEQAIANSGRERDRMRLEQRTAEADAAKMRADAAANQARIAQANAETAQRSAEQAQRATADARRDTADAQAKAQEAQARAQDAEARARQLELQLGELAAKQTERGLVVTLSDVLFNVDQAQLTADGVAKVQKLADVLQKNPQRVVLIEGFTDSTGSAAHNQDLSERRALSVQSALAGMGVARERIATRGYGMAYPVGDNATAMGRQLNRRVEIIISGEGAKVLPR